MAEMFATQWKIFGVETILLVIVSKFNIELKIKLNRKLKYTLIIYVQFTFYPQLEKSYFTAHLTFVIWRKWKPIFKDIFRAGLYFLHQGCYLSQEGVENLQIRKNVSMTKEVHENKPFFKFKIMHNHRDRDLKLIACWLSVCWCVLTCSDLLACHVSDSWRVCSVAIKATCWINYLGCAVFTVFPQGCLWLPSAPPPVRAMHIHVWPNHHKQLH